MFINNLAGNMKGVRRQPIQFLQKLHVRVTQKLRNRYEIVTKINICFKMQHI